MTESTCSLRWLTSEKVFLGRPLKKGQRGDGGWPRPLEVVVHADRWTFGLPLSAMVFGPLGWVSWAFLAPGMLAGDANLIGAKRDITTMACPAYADAHDLFHPLRISTSRGCPFARIELESILHEHGTSLFFLNCIAGGSGLGKPLAGLCESGLGILDRLLQSSRHRGWGRSPDWGNRLRSRGEGKAAIFFQLRTSTQS